MNPAQNITTLSLLNSHCDAIHSIYHNIFRLLRPIRRKYRLSVNECIVLNGVYLYHKVKGSIMSANAIYNWITYYNKPKLNYYIDDLCGKGFLMKAEVIKNIQYYKLTELGIEVMNGFNSSYMEILSKWYVDNSISI
jgi:hypothetical protein